MKYNQLVTKPVEHSHRLGRGIASGHGKTAGRGTKGQGARTGYSKRPGFAGGSNPMMQRLPKLPGFTSHRTKAENVYTGDLNSFAGKAVDAQVLFAAGLVSSPFNQIKLIVKGDLKKPVNVKLPLASKSAIAAIESNGGSFTKVNRLQRPAKKSEKSEQ